MAELAFRDGVMDRIKLREPRFDEHAYLFVLSALEFCQGRLTERRHITGRELAEACRDLAIQRYGVLARMVLEHWGMTETAHIGDVVFTLVELHYAVAVASGKSVRLMPVRSTPPMRWRGRCLRAIGVLSRSAAANR